jgi:UDP-GlcNAc:undecaprenyl-phosphate GlcNAc-1-phosphate transferase
MHTQIIFFLLIFINIIIFLNFSKISKLLNIFDCPDNVRKFHKKPIAILGGPIIFLSLLIIFIFGYFFNNIFFEIGFNKEQIVIFLFFSTIIFLIYLFDDIKNISPNYKLLGLSFLIVVYLLFDSGSIISSLRISSYKQVIDLHKLSIPFTVLCILLFVNAINMFDGINLQCGSYCFFIFIILFFLTKNFLFLFFLIPLITFLFLNYFNICFLGNSGSALLSFIISILIIKTYNSGIFYVEDIFLLMCIPGYDLLRLALVRVMNKKHPFFPDRNHLHHLILNKYSFYLAFFLIFLFVVIINLINIFFKFPPIFLIFLSIFLYSLIIFYFRDDK